MSYGAFAMWLVQLVGMGLKAAQLRNLA